MRHFAQLLLILPFVVSPVAAVAADPVIQHGEMVAGYHKYYGSAALRFVNEAHQKLAKQSF